MCSAGPPEKIQHTLSTCMSFRPLRMVISHSSEDPPLRDRFWWCHRQPIQRLGALVIQRSLNRDTSFAEGPLHHLWQMTEIRNPSMNTTLYIYPSITSRREKECLTAEPSVSTLILELFSHLSLNFWWMYVFSAFVTGNQNKLREVKEILSSSEHPIQVISQNLDSNVTQHHHSQNLV